VNVTKQRLKLH